MATDTNTLGTVRLGNKRQNSPLKPRPGETVIDIDRTNPILGNPFVLKDHRNDAQRAAVIARYEQKYHDDIRRHGPMARATEDLAERAKRGDNLILMCWCAPRPCHGHSVMRRIAELVEKAARPETINSTRSNRQCALFPIHSLKTGFNPRSARDRGLRTHPWTPQDPTLPTERGGVHSRSRRRTTPRGIG